MIPCILEDFLVVRNCLAVRIQQFQAGAPLRVRPGTVGQMYNTVEKMVIESEFDARCIGGRIVHPSGPEATRYRGRVQPLPRPRCLESFVAVTASVAGALVLTVAGASAGAAFAGFAASPAPPGVGATTISTSVCLPETSEMLLKRNSCHGRVCSWNSLMSAGFNPSNRCVVCFVFPAPAPLAVDG